MKHAAAAFALLLVISLGFSLWNQTLIINATDMHGLPLEAAQGSITYQKASSLSEDDGLLTGVTGENGLFSAPLENKVPALQQSYKVKVTVYTSYWEGETRIMELNNSDPKTFINGTDPRNFTFMVPVELEQAYIEVLSSAHAPVSGADVVIAADAQLKRSTGERGGASFLLPKGMVFSGVNPKRDLVEIIELKDHPFFVGVQFHPEFKSRPLRPHPLFRDFIAAAIR